MMTNEQFCNTLSLSFNKFLSTGSRSNAKLKILHAAVATDIQDLLGETYSVKSLGINDSKEGTVIGRYLDKKVDIVIEQNGNVIAGIGVKFVMQNYMQNSNNYFENMLGETANIRSRHIPYFQVLVIPDKIPYYKKDGTFCRWEEINQHNLHKYKVLSADNTDTFMHTPNKTLLYVVHIPDSDRAFVDRTEYNDYYLERQPTLTLTNKQFEPFGTAVIFNDYQSFINRVYHSVLAI